LAAAGDGLETLFNDAQAARLVSKTKTGLQDDQSAVVGMSWHRLTKRSGSEWRELAQAGFDWRRLASTGSDWHRLASNGANWRQFSFETPCIRGTADQNQTPSPPRSAASPSLAFARSAVQFAGSLAAAEPRFRTQEGGPPELSATATHSAVGKNGTSQEPHEEQKALACAGAQIEPLRGEWQKQHQGGTTRRHREIEGNLARSLR